jgi:hypothetical protein
MTTMVPPPPYHVQNLIDNPKAFAHHTSVSALWINKWRRPCAAGVYPFVDGKVEDFDPIFENLRTQSSDNVSILSDPDAYAAPFLPVGKHLADRAAQAEKEGDLATAKDLFLRAAAVYRIARFPINRSKLSQEAWERGKAAYLAGGKYLDPPNEQVEIPFTHADTSAGDKSEAILGYLRIPKGSKPTTGWPVLLFVSDLPCLRCDSRSC